MTAASLGDLVGAPGWEVCRGDLLGQPYVNEEAEHKPMLFTCVYLLRGPWTHVFTIQVRYMRNCIDRAAAS